MSKFQMEEMIAGKDKHFSNDKFLAKVKSTGLKLGMSTLHAASTLFFAVKNPDMSKANKLIILGALGYFVLPFDVIADILPFVGLTDDIFVITTALAKVYSSITDETKLEAHQFLKKTFGEHYEYELTPKE
ncbi:YkvA family protein [Bacillus ndiopicus]|uniref:YkvA family protein n=1 Tax=Bacillus ndiopicus TaxID=1347368 RepID=UPI0005A6D725|nr:YkvA family protein [Bacillus ndiopicus]